MPTYRVYLAKPTTNPPVWDFATTIVRSNPAQALQDAYEQWVASHPGYIIPPLNQCRSQVNIVTSDKETKVNLVSTDETSGVQYTLTVLNHSSNPTNIAVFQQDPDIGVSNVFSLAWFTKFSYPQTTIKFNWTISYNFVWCQTGVLAPGVVFDASQSPAAGLQTNNQILLDYDPINNAYFFNPITPATVPPLGILRVKQSPAVPLKQASVGIGMSGFGTFVVQAQPNITVNFTPNPKYYIVAGNFTQGQVLDISETTGSAEVAFPPGIYQMTATLNIDNTWTIQPTSQANKIFLLSKENDPNAQWGL
jgi:rhizosphere induced protein